MIRPEDTSLRILHLEDSDFDAELIVREMRRGGVDFILRRVETQPDFERTLEEFDPDIILADFKLPTFDGGKALAIAKRLKPETPVIIVSGAVGEDVAIELLRNGATDFVLKERLNGRLVPAIQRAMSEVWNKRARIRGEEERKQLNIELLRVARHDYLTGAASRSLVMEQLDLAIGMVDPLAPDSVFFYIDLDRFKEINNNYGTSFGDQLLVETARRLDSLCHTDCLLGNFGGDRFFLLMRHLRLEKDLSEISDKILGVFERPFPLRGFQIKLHASVGGVVLSSRETSSSDIMLQGEEAMRMVKNKERKGICMVDDSMIKELERRKTLDHTVDDVIKNERMFLLFQPIVDLEVGAYRGAEALLRCQLKNGQEIPTADFIESLMRTRSMAQVDELVFARFIRNDMKFALSHLEGNEFRFSFNISPGILGAIGYAESIIDQLHAERISPAMLSLEVLETDLLATNGEVLENLSLLRKAGVKIAIDDFGTGYSNPMRLSQLPIDTVKIDRSYLSGIATGDAKRNAVLATLIDISKHLGYSITAEGVENKVQSDYLRSLGCHVMQGFFYGKPMPLDDLLRVVVHPMTPFHVTR